MADKDLTLQIKSQFDDSGAKDAVKAAEEVGDKTAQAGKQATDQLKATDDAAKKATSAVSGIGAMAEKSGAKAQSGLSKARAGVESVSKGVATLNKLVTGFGIIGLISSVQRAYNTIKNLVDFIKDKATASLREAAKTAGEMADKLADKRIEAAGKMIGSLADSYTRVATAIDRARTAQSGMVSAWDDLNRARREVDDMALDRQEKDELARVPDDDEAGKTAVRNKYAASRADIEFSRRAADAARAEQSAQDDLAAASGRRSGTQDAIKGATGDRATLASQLDAAKDAAFAALRRTIVLNTWESVSSPTKVVQYEIDRADYARSTKEAEELTKQLAALDKSIAALKETLPQEMASERNAEIRLSAAKLRGGAGIAAASALTEQEKAALGRDTERAQAEAAVKAAEAEQKREEERIRARAEGPKARVESERADVAEAKSKLEDRRGTAREPAAKVYLERQIAELKAAEAANARVQEQITAALVQLRRNQDKFATSLQNIPNT